MHTPPGDSLGIGLFQQGAPELVSIWGAEVNQLVVHSGQQVVYPHLLPLAVLPELSRGGRQRQAKFNSAHTEDAATLLFVGNVL